MENQISAMRLYKACKWEVEHFQAEHGMSLPQMWDMVHGRIEGYKHVAKWWMATCLDDYREQREF